MRHRLMALAVAALSLAVQSSTRAQTPPPVRAQPTPPATPAPPPPPPAPAQDARFDSPSMLSGADSAGQGPISSATPRMIGDFPGYVGRGFVTNEYFLSGDFANIRMLMNNPATGVPSNQKFFVIIDANGEPRIVTQNQLTNYAKVQEVYEYAALTFGRGAFKVAENESVQPQDRFYLTYAYFHQIPNQLLASGGLMTLPTNSIFGTPGTYVLRNTLANSVNNTGAPANLTTPDVSTTNLHRETIGFEKTFFCGNASVGVRLPVFQSDAAASTSFSQTGLASFATFPSTADTFAAGNTLDQSHIGDVSFILKYAPINDANRVVSGGLVVTAPTGGGIQLADGSKLYSTLLQPWLGGFCAWDRLYVHGFTSIAVPTDNRDLTIFFNDIGVGYFLYRAPECSWLTSITPTIECHVNTPLDKQRDGGISGNDAVFMTGGVHFGIGQRTTLSFSVATPVTGPRQDQLEAAVQLNWNF